MGLSGSSHEREMLFRDVLSFRITVTGEGATGREEEEEEGETERETQRGRDRQRETVTEQKRERESSSEEVQLLMQYFVHPVDCPWFLSRPNSFWVSSRAELQGGGRGGGVLGGGLPFQMKIFPLNGFIGGL